MKEKSQKCVFSYEQIDNALNDRSNKFNAHLLQSNYPLKHQFQNIIMIHNWSNLLST